MISQGLQLIRHSLRVLKQHKSLIIFPLISTISWLLLVSLLVSPIWYLVEKHWQQVHAFSTDEIGIIVFALVILFIGNLIVLFCNAAFISGAEAYCRQQPVKLSQCFKAAFVCGWEIIQWTIFNVTIGFFLRTFQTRATQMSFLGKSLAGIAWSVIMYIALPVLVIEKLPPFKIIQRSSELLQQTWGPNLVTNLGIGMILFCARLLALAPAIIGLIWGAQIGKMTGIALAVILLLLFHIFNVAIHNILRSVVYHYATSKQIVFPFEKTQLENVFKKR